MALGFVVLLVVLSIICVALGMSSYSRMRNATHAFAWLAWLSLSVLGLAFNLLMFLVGGFEGDADRGTLEIYKTPLGGGYYLLSRMNDSDLPLPLKHIDGQSDQAIGDDNLVKGLSCAAGQTYLQFEDSYGRIDLHERVLVRISQEDIPQSYQDLMTWTSKYSLSATPCAKVEFTRRDLWRNAQIYLTIPFLVIASFLALLTWGRRLPRLPQAESPDW